MKRRRFFESLTAVLLAVLIGAVLAAPAMAQGNSGNNKNKDKNDDGGGDDGTEEPAPLPPIEYVPIYVPMPNPSSFVGVNDLNDYGVVVGRYFELETEELRAMIYDPSLAVALDLDPTTAIDLNDLPIVGLDANWIISSAVGINNNGLVVGYVTPRDDPAHRRGYVLDLTTMIIYEIPDEDLAGVETYARKVNDNGVIHGQFADEDGIRYAYLFDPGLRDKNSADLNVEIINAPIQHMSAVMDNPPPGESTTLTAQSVSLGIIQYVKGSQSLVERSDLEGGVYDVNDQGEILGRRFERVKFRGSTITNYFAWREIEGITEEIEMLSSKRSMSLWGMNNDGTVLAHVDSVLSLYHDDYGLVDLAVLSPPTDFWDFKMNSTGPLGYGQIAGSTPDYEIIVLTPVDMEP